MINIQKLIEQAMENGYLGDKTYIRSLDKSDKRWIDEDIKVITQGLMDFVRQIPS